MAMFRLLTTLALLVGSTTTVPQIEPPNAARVTEYNAADIPKVTRARSAPWGTECIITRHGYCKACFYRNRWPCTGILVNGRAVQKTKQYYTDKFPDIAWNTDFEQLALDEGVATEHTMLKCMGFTYALLNGTACTAPRDDDFFRAAGLMAVAKRRMQPRGGDFRVVRDSGEWVVEWDDPTHKPLPQPEVDDDFGGIAPAAPRLPTNTWTQSGAVGAWGGSFGGSSWASTCRWGGRGTSQPWRWHFNWRGC